MTAAPSAPPLDALGTAQRLEGATRLDGEALLPGLQLDLTAIWQV
ncbi:MAG: hypothetical protein ACKO5M_10170 [Vulcanococcus sp.]